MDNGESSYRRFLAGDDGGMVELIRVYKDGLIIYLSSYTDNLASAEDCVQDTFIRLAVKKPHFSGRSTFKTWLYTIGRNIAIDHARKRNRHRNAGQEELEAVADVSDLESGYLVTERRVTLYRALERLKKEYRQALYLTYFEEFSATEAADVMGKSRRQVENLLYNARKALRSELEKEGFSYDDI
ncbi:RNA polymerase sigma factor [uncultured Ruminococcus sp.]|uniref:RNA polymerase sigma factor n=1 Tax=uncultured Ruminococcus sp. TaxID=165186 RepID=UPI002610F291|nr:RNA polymerase sigma factor [uncultured Ruminococcus sp.]